MTSRRENPEEDESPEWLPEPLTDQERSWIRDRPRNIPSAKIVVTTLFCVAWLGLVFGLIAAVAAGVSVADCEESILETCENAEEEGWLVGAAVAGGTIGGTISLWAWGHLLDLNLESRERLEDLFALEARRDQRERRRRRSG